MSAGPARCRRSPVNLLAARGAAIKARQPLEESEQEKQGWPSSGLFPSSNRMPRPAI
jgi:hypothetical protein